MTLRHFLFASFSMLLLLLFARSNVAQVGGDDLGQEFRVTGVVVDDLGAPVANAKVSVFIPPAKNVPDQILFAFHTSTKGVFFLDDRTHSSEFILFIDESPPIGFWSPLSNLLEEERLLVAPLKGLKFKITKRNMSLGKVRLPYRYGKIVIDTASIFSDGAFAPVRDDFELTIFDETGRNVDQGRIPSDVIDETSKQLRLALPVKRFASRWGIRLQRTNAKGFVESFEHFFILKQSECKSLRKHKVAKITESPCRHDG